MLRCSTTTPVEDALNENPKQKIQKKWHESIGRCSWWWHSHQTKNSFWRNWKWWWFQIGIKNFKIICWRKYFCRFQRRGNLKSWWPRRRWLFIKPATTRSRRYFSPSYFLRQPRDQSDSIEKLPDSKPEAALLLWQNSNSIWHPLTTFFGPKCQWFEP